MESLTKASSLALCAAVYIIALIAGVVTYMMTPELPLWQRIAAADVVGTFVVFAASWRTNNSSMYDAYWSVAPMVIVAGLWLVAEPSAQLLRQVVVFALVWWWGARLTYNWARGWSGMAHEDWRYVDLRAQSGSAYWLVSLTGIHFFPTLLVFLGCLSLFPAMVTGSAPVGWLDAAAFAVTAGAILCELVADRQLHAFRQSKPPREAIMQSGLWSWSRHPNYFGEMMFWWGLCLFGLAASPGSGWLLVGPVAMTLLFFVVSVPMIEKRMVKRRPHYEAHKKQVSMIVPLPPKKAP
ncbi:MAG: steroid 5-alpha reductase family enzyme [Flavobacteriales bacterium]